MPLDKVLLAHIITAIKYVHEYVSGLDKTAFLEDTRTQDAVIRRIEIIGEACKGISPMIKSKAPQIPWKGMAGMRDILIHQYQRVELDIVWKVVTDELRVHLITFETLHKELPESTNGSGNSSTG
jgi:uncharacterized protein with HEPN domain